MSEDAATDESPPATSAPADETADTPDEATGDTEPDSTSSEPPEPEPTPQTEALRRQQLYVGTGVSALAGVAVVVAGIQQFPGFSLLVYLLFGMATTTLLFGLLVASMFASASE
ncbi:hypothetical protein [Salinibaculum rarum]|uniref:hypothetical protein n=1 Tax=Salinibaculum rarum TaxID=3058903 RepID=UPI0026600376|nr:hypothetical protein [Salinibaculum sp. KK48]